MHKTNIFLVIEALSMLVSAQIKTVKPPDKKPGISDRSSFLRRRSVDDSFGRNCVTKFPCPGCFKSMLAYVIHPQNTKNPSCVCSRCALWYESVRFMEFSTCKRLVSVGKLN